MTPNYLIAQCPVCQSKCILPMVDLPAVPVFCNVLWPTRKEALRARKAEISLVFCRECSHVFNVGFEERLTEYSVGYENSLHFSERFQRYAKSLALDLIQSYDLRRKGVIEIGCGRGDFLRLLCRLGNNTGLGFDPSYVGELDQQGDDKVEIIKGPFTTENSSFAAELVCSRHLLEHLSSPGDLLRVLHDSSRAGGWGDTVFVFEVPNSVYSFKGLGIWDLIYEHCSYFNEYSLQRLFRMRGYRVLRIGEAYGGQFLRIDAKIDRQDSGPVRVRNQAQSEWESLARNFRRRYREKLQGWKRFVSGLRTTEKEVVLWGGGSKGVTFLNLLQIRNQIRYVVDINPRKEGLYIPGTGQRVVSPEFLRVVGPDLIIVMNPIYKEEIRATLKGLQIETEIKCA